MTHRRRPRLARLLPLAAILACRTGEPPDAASTNAPRISRAGDTTFVTNAEPGLDGAVTLQERWVRPADTARLGTITAAALGHGGTVWFAVTGGSERTAIYRDTRDGALIAVTPAGRDTGSLMAPLMLTALEDGSLLAVEQDTGRTLRFDSTGVARDSSTIASLAGVTAIAPDRSGGWFARLSDNGLWRHHDQRGIISDTLRDDGAATALVGLGRDGSQLRAASGGRQLERSIAGGPILTARWDGTPLAGTLAAAHDAKGLIWIGSDLGAQQIWRAFDRDARLRFVITIPAGSRVLDRDGEFLLLQDADGGLRVMEVVGTTG